MQSKPGNVFVSYARRDLPHLNRLRVHLRPLERDHQVDLWADTRISPGSKWREEIATAIESANVAILLISADFLASEFIVKNELPPLLSAAASGGLTVLPVVIGHCRFEQTPGLSEYQAVNSPSRPLASLPVAERERIWVRVANSVEAVFQGRQLTEGWSAAHERLALHALQAFVEGSGENVLIISVIDYYVQFLFDPDAKSFYCEAVSNFYLPDSLKLTDKSEALLASMGFRKPLEAGKNYSRLFALSGDVIELEEISRLAIKVFSDVYCVSKNAELIFTRLKS